MNASLREEVFRYFSKTFMIQANIVIKYPGVLADTHCFWFCCLFLQLLHFVDVDYFREKNVFNSILQGHFTSWRRITVTRIWRQGVCFC